MVSLARTPAAAADKRIDRSRAAAANDKAWSGASEDVSGTRPVRADAQTLDRSSEVAW